MKKITLEHRISLIGSDISELNHKLRDASDMRWGVNENDITALEDHQRELGKTIEKAKELANV